MKLKWHKNANTRITARAALLIFYKWYTPIAGIANPAIGLEKIRKYIADPKLIHPDELERMLHQLNLMGGDWGRRSCAVIAFLADTGARIEELEKLKLGDIKLIKGSDSEPGRFEVTVPALKGTYARTIPFSNLLDGGIGEYFARYYIWAVIEKKQRYNAPLFYQLGNKFFKTEDNMNKPLLRGGINYIIKKASYWAGIDRKISPNQFRHFFATYSIINGLNIFTLKELMGHVNIATTQRYIHIAERVSGDILKHSATKNVKVPKNIIGYSQILKDLAQRI